MVTQSSGIAEIMRRLAALETRVDRLHRVGKVTEADYENLVFTVQPLEDGSPAPLTGVRSLYTRMHPHLTEFALPEKDEIVRLEELNKNSYVITGSYGHNVVQPEFVTVPVTASWGATREEVPREIQTVDAGIQLRARNVEGDENAFIYLGRIRTNGVYGVAISQQEPGFGGYEFVLDGFGVSITRIIENAGERELVPATTARNIIVLGEIGYVDPTEDLESKNSVQFDTTTVVSRTGSGGNPSHSHSVPEHAHEVPPHVHDLPMRPADAVYINEGHG